MQEQPKQIGNYLVLRVIGKGGFGTVYLCEEKRSKELFAIKEIKDKLRIDPKTEVEIHKRLMKKHSRRVVKMYEDFEFGGFVYLVMEYCKEGSLRDYVRNNGRMEVLLATDIISQLCDALKLIHKEDIAHRDLTPNNVLIWELLRGQNNVVKRILVKVTDFGLSKETPRNAKGQFKTTLGTGPFMAPEVFAGKYTKDADVFALGSMFYFLLTKSYLPSSFNSQSDNLLPFLEKVMDNKSIKKLDSNVQKDLRDFIRGMLCPEIDRIRLDEINKHDYIHWYMTNRCIIDPELGELCSHSQNEYLRGRSSSRSQSRETVRKPLMPINRYEAQKHSNKDSAFGSDQSHSGSGRCRHLEIDRTGRCKTCPFKVSNIVQKLDQLHLSEPTKRKLFSENTIKNGRNVKSDMPYIQTTSASKDKQFEAKRSLAIINNNEAVYNLTEPPWPLPIITHNYTAVNEYGRCIFIKYSDINVQKLQLVVVLERTVSKVNQTIGKIFELRQNGTDQELRIFQPESQNVEKPKHDGRRIKTAKELIPCIRSCADLDNYKMAKDGYETIWNFLRMSASKITQANCEEIVNNRKYRIELCLNGWVKLFIGPKKPENIDDFKISGIQKTDNGQFELKTGVNINEVEKRIATDLAKAIRTDVKESVWKKFNRRNIRCTIYTHGFERM